MSNIRRTCGRRGAAARATVPATALATALATTLALGACTALSGDGPRDDAAAGELRVVRYAVERGDRLALIARDFTGDLELWRTIADLNGIDDPRRLAVGRILEIPLALIPEADREARLAASLPGPADTVAGEDDDATNAATRLAEMRADASSPVDGIDETDETDGNDGAVPAVAAPGGAVRVAAEPVVVSPVRSREAFELSPLETTGSAAGAGDRFVKVIGSYTPKGVYEEPAGQSRVLMRITPGTVLPLERRVDGWYRVRTTAGPGYLRDGDAVPVEGGDGSRGGAVGPGSGG